MPHFSRLGIIDNPDTNVAMYSGSGVVSNQRLVTDVLFYTNLKLVSLLDAFSYAVYDKDNTLVTSGTSTGTDYFNDVSAFTVTDPISVYFLKYGYTLKNSGFVLTPVETLMYMEHVVNPFIVADIVTAEAYADTGVTDKIIVDSIAKTLTVNVAITDQQLYDYMQWWQAQPANSGSLNEGNIYNTIDNVNFILSGTWIIIPTGGDLYVAISPNSKTGDYVLNPDGSLTDRKYSSTFPTIESALSNSSYGRRDLVPDNISQYYHVFKDGSPYIRTNSTINCKVSGLTSQTNKFYIQCAPTEFFKGIVNDAVKFIDNAVNSYGYGFDCTGGIELYGLHSVVDDAVDSQRTAIRLDITALADSCIGKSRYGKGIQLLGSSTANRSTLMNSIGYGSSRGIELTNYADFKCYNCLAYANTRGFYGGYNTVSCEIIGNVSIDNTTIDWAFQQTGAFKQSNDIFRYNVCSDNSISAHGSFVGTIENIISNDEFQDPLNYDFHLTGTSTLRLHSTDITTFGVYKDFDGDTRTAPHSIGVDHPTSFLVPVVLTTVEASTGLPVQGVTTFGRAGAGGVIAEGTSLFSDVTIVDGSLTYYYLYTGTDQPLNGRSRKGTLSPFYKTAIFSGIITKDGLTLTVYMTQET